MINFRHIKLRIADLKQASLARDTLWIIIAKGTSIFIQAAYFVIIARSLGVKQYGVFVSVIALVKIVTPFASWGSEFILLKNVSRNYSLFAEFWGNALLIISVGGLILITLVLFNYSTFLSSAVPFLVVLFAAISDLIFSLILKTATKAFQAVRRLDIAAQLEILSSSTRLMAALCLVAFFTPGIVTWAGLYAIATMVTAGIGLCLVQYHLGKPKLSLKRLKAELVQGFYFSVSTSSMTINNHVDKTMLLRLATSEAVGIYAAAYRLIDVSFVPILSLVFASYPQFFREGTKGIDRTIGFVKKLLPTAVAYSLLVGVAILLLAPVVPYILGHEYATAIAALRWLALLPLLKCLHILAGNILTGVDLQGVRTAMQLSMALFNFMLNLWLIPLYSWRGAACSSLASDGLLALGCWGIVAWHCSHQVRGGAA